MLNVVSSLRNLEIHATDGMLGTVSDFLFDDNTWQVRWMVVDTGNWLPGRKVLVHPSAVVSADFDGRQLSVSLTMTQVKESPDLLRDRPVSRQMQNDLYSYYGWDPLWAGGAFGGGLQGGAMFGGVARGAIASPLSAPVYFGANAVREAEHGVVEVGEGDPHLRSVAEVTGYHVHATDGNIGHVEDFLIESESWAIGYLIVDTSNWWVGQHVLISPQAVKNVDWSDHSIEVDLARDKVRSSPSWNRADSITCEFERQLHQHYNWPNKWQG